RRPVRAPDVRPGDRPRRISVLRSLARAPRGRPKGREKMRIKSLAAVSAALMLGAMPTANAEELIVYHGWSSKAEVAALNVLQGGLNDKGHTWKDLAIPHNSGVNVSIVNMVTGGDPPNAFVTSDPHIFRDLAGL